jgi:hypothetical protein
MAERMHRTQFLLPVDEYRRLSRIAREKRRSFGSLVREALANQYPERTERSVESRLAAVREITEMQLPVPETWEELEESIARAHTEGCFD